MLLLFLISLFFVVVVVVVVDLLAQLCAGERGPACLAVQLHADGAASATKARRFARGQVADVRVKGYKATSQSERLAALPLTQIRPQLS